MAYIAGTAINIYLLIYIVRLLRFKVGVWSPYNVEPKLESIARDFGGSLKWIGPIVVLNLVLLSLSAVAMLSFYIFNSFIRGGSY